MSVDTATVQKLQDLSCLQINVIGQSALPLVQMAYAQDPAALTDDLIQDAFFHGATVEVIQFLVDKKQMPTNAVSAILAKTSMKAMPELINNPNAASATTLVVQRLKSLCLAFPQEIINQDVFSRYCPMRLVLNCNCFPVELMDHMAKTLPNSVKALSIAPFHLPRENAYVHQSLRTELDEQRIQGLSDVLTKVQYLCASCPRGWTQASYEAFFQLLFQKKIATTRLHLNISKFTFHAPSEKLILPTDSCQIKTLSLYFRCPLYPIVSLSLKLRFLQRLDIKLVNDVEATQFLADALCELIQLDRLRDFDVEGKTQTVGLYAPLIAAAGKSKSLMLFQLHGLRRVQETKDYQESMMKILGSNMQLMGVLILHTVTTSVIMPDWRTRLRQHINKDWFLDGKEGSDNQRQIDMKTLLNQCGRGTCSDTTTSRKAFVDLLSTETLLRKLFFLDLTDKTTEERFLHNMAYGLLREAPSKWTGQDILLGGNVAASGRKRQLQSACEGSGKRKALNEEAI